MTMTITADMLTAYAPCPRKAYLLMCSEERGQIHEYEQILAHNRLAHQHKHIDLLSQSEANVQPYSVDNLKKGCEMLVNAELTADGLQADGAILTKADKRTYEPTIFIGTHRITDTDKRRLWFTGHVLAKVQGRPPTRGRIISVDGTSSLVKLAGNPQALVSPLESLRRGAGEASPLEEPPVLLNKHCPSCQFRAQGAVKAVQEDHLSRLRGVTPKVIRR